MLHSRYLSKWIEFVTSMKNPIHI